MSFGSVGMALWIVDMVLMFCSEFLAAIASLGIFVEDGDFKLC